MLTVKKILAFFCTVFLVISSVLAQDSLGAIKDWKVVSKKLDKGKYELSFSGTISGGWQVYAPNQVLLEIKTTELKFADSSIVQQGDFVLQTKPTEISSAIFENTKVSVYETAVEWKTVIGRRNFLALCIIPMERKMNFIRQHLFSLSFPWKMG